MMYCIALLLLVQGSFASRFGLVGNGWCLSSSANRLKLPGISWQDATVGADGSSEMCALQCQKNPACIGYMTEDMTKCDIILKSDVHAESGIESVDSESRNFCFQKVCVPTWTYQAADGTSVNLKGVGAVGGFTTKENPGYIFSVVDEKTCIRSVLSTTQKDLHDWKGSGRVPASFKDFTNVDSWAWGWDHYGSIEGMKQDPDPSCQYMQAVPEVHYPDHCPKPQIDDGGYFRASGTCKVQGSCVGGFNDPGNDQMCVVTMLKDGKPSVISGDTDFIGVTFITHSTWLPYWNPTSPEDIPFKIPQGNIFRWDCRGNCEWQICFEDPPVTTVNCGEFFARSCADCAQGNDQASWCNGDCKWVSNFCVAKTESALALENDKLKAANKALKKALEAMAT